MDFLAKIIDAYKIMNTHYTMVACGTKTHTVCDDTIFSDLSLHLNKLIILEIFCQGSLFLWDANEPTHNSAGDFHVVRLISAIRRARSL